MKKEKILYLLERLSMPVLLCALGLALLLAPDTASALVGRVAGIGLLVVGLLHLAEGLSARLDTGRRVTIGLVCLVAAVWLLRHPLALAAWIGRLAGIYFVIRGLGELRDARRLGQRLTLPLITTLAGALLILSPMITSRLVLKAMGVVLFLVGLLQILSRLGQQKRLDGPDDNIIDV